MSYCEPAFRQYLAAFDGTQKDFSEVEPLFNALYHDNFTVMDKCYNDDNSDKYGYETYTRDEVKEMHSEYLAKGSSVTIVHYRKIGWNCIDVEFRAKNEDEDRTLRVIYSIEDGKLASAREVDSFASILRARCASDVRLWGVCGASLESMGRICKYAKSKLSC